MDNHPRQKSTRVLSMFYIFMILYGTAENYWNLDSDLSDGLPNARDKKILYAD